MDSPPQQSAQVHVLEQASNHFPANEQQFSRQKLDDKRTALGNTVTYTQYSTQVAVDANLNPSAARRFVYHEPEVINQPLQHKQRWRW